MAANKRTPVQIDRDRRDIAHLYLLGWTQNEIAEHLNADPERDYSLSQQMISYDLQRIEDDWRDAAVRDLDEAKARELARIDKLEREYWEAWERSCLPEETLRQEGSPQENPSRVVKTKRGQTGDPRFLAGVQWCIDRRCKLLGVDAPERMEVSGPHGGPIEQANVELDLSHHTDEELWELRRLVEKAIDGTGECAGQPASAGDASQSD